MDEKQSHSCNCARVCLFIIFGHIMYPLGILFLFQSHGHKNCNSRNCRSHHGRCSFHKSEDDDDGEDNNDDGGSSKSASLSLLGRMVWPSFSFSSKAVVVFVLSPPAPPPPAAPPLLSLSSWACLWLGNLGSTKKADKNCENGLGHCYFGCFGGMFLLFVHAFLAFCILLIRQLLHPLFAILFNQFL